MTGGGICNLIQMVDVLCVKHFHTSFRALFPSHSRVRLRFSRQGLDLLATCAGSMNFVRMRCPFRREAGPIVIADMACRSVIPNWGGSGNPRPRSPDQNGHHRPDVGVDALRDRAGYDGAFGQIPPMCIDRLKSFGNHHQTAGSGSLARLSKAFQRAEVSALKARSPPPDRARSSAGR